MKLKILVLFQLTFFLIVSCDNTALFPKNAQNSGNEPRIVRAFAAVSREMPDETSGFGSLSFLSKVDITSPQEAVIRRLYFREGDYISEGQIIVLLENPQINIAVERAENNFSQVIAAYNLANARLMEGTFNAEAQLLALEKAGAELSLAKRKWEEDRRKHLNQETLFEAGGIHTEAILVSRFSLDSDWEHIQLMERELEIRRIGCRDQDLVKAGIIVPSDENERKNAVVLLMTTSLRAELEASQAMLEAAEKELASVNISLAELTIRSPASGIVGARYLEEGERVRFQDKIISLIDTTSLYAIFPVREKDALRIKKGMAASVLTDGTGETYSGSVDLVYPQADSQSLSFLVRVLLLNTGELEKLKPGMFARITIALGRPVSAVYVPEAAIFNKKNSEGSVFIINGSVLAERKIVLGSVYGEEREIKAGITQGELVVARPDSDLREGTNVSVTE